MQLDRFTEKAQEAIVTAQQGSQSTAAATSASGR